MANKRGCYRCQSTCGMNDCRICSGKVLCNRCATEANKRDSANH